MAPKKKASPEPITEAAPIATIGETVNLAPVDEAETKTPPPPRPPVKSEEQLRVQYTDAELLEIGKKLAEAARMKEAIEDEKKSVTKSFGSRLDGVSAKISELSNNLSSGFTYRGVTVETTYGEPGPGRKTTRRLDTGATIRVEAMTLAEMQSELPFKADDERDAITIDRPDTTDRIQPATSVDGVVTVDADEDIFANEDKNNL